MKIKRVVVDTVEFGESSFRRTPKGLDTVDMVRSFGKLVLSVFDSEVFLVANIDEAVVATPTIAVNDGL
jgi:hypothetical protein